MWSQEQAMCSQRKTPNCTTSVWRTPSSVHKSTNCCGSWNWRRKTRRTRRRRTLSCRWVARRTSSCLRSRSRLFILRINSWRYFGTRALSKCSKCAPWRKLWSKQSMWRCSTRRFCKTCYKTLTLSTRCSKSCKPTSHNEKTPIRQMALWSINSSPV